MIRIVSTVHGRTLRNTLLLAGARNQRLVQCRHVDSIVLQQRLPNATDGVLDDGWLAAAAEHVQMITPRSCSAARRCSCMPGTERAAPGRGRRSRSRTRFAAVQRILLTLSAFVTGAAVWSPAQLGLWVSHVPHVLRLLSLARITGFCCLCQHSAASFLILADLAARVVVRPVELQVGIVTAFVGAPYFIYLLRRSRSERGIL